MSKSIISLILGIVCVWYGTVIMSVRSGTKFYVVWYLLAAFFLSISAIGFFHVWEKMSPVAVKLIFAVIVILAVALTSTAIVILANGTAEDEDCDTIIVLGAQVKQNGPSVVLKFRLDAAAEYLTNHKMAKCIVSGGQGRTEPCTEAEAMGAYLVQMGIEPSRIIQEPKATTTKENFEFSKLYCDFENDKIGVVTNSFHEFRSVLLAKKAGYGNVVRIPAGSIPLYLPNNVLRECLAVWKDLICGNLV